jgi:hypothetical protein
MNPLDTSDANQSAWSATAHLYRHTPLKRCRVTYRPRWNQRQCVFSYRGLLTTTFEKSRLVSSRWHDDQHDDDCGADRPDAIGLALPPSSLIYFARTGSRPRGTHELENIALDSNRTIDIDECVPKDEGKWAKLPLCEKAAAGALF